MENNTAVETTKIKLIATGDVHGAIFPYDFIENEPLNTSLAQIYTYIKEQRSVKSQEVVLLDNGDFLQGQPVVYYSNYEHHEGPHICADVMNFMGYDAASVGNHDLETGHEVYDKLVKEFNFPWLAANAVNKKTGEPYFAPYAIINRKNVKIAVIGMITPTIPVWLPDKIWEGMEFHDMVECAKKWVKIVKEKENPDLIVGLFHSGVDSTYNNHSDEDYMNENASNLVAQCVPGFDIIFAGHDHQEFNMVVRNCEGGRVIILDPKNCAKLAAVASVQIKKENGKLVDKKITGLIMEMNSCEPDREMMKRYADYIKMIKRYVSKPIAKFTRTISSRDAMFGNSAFVDLIHSIQLEATGADVSFAAPLTFDSKVDKGTVCIRDMFKLYKFENLLYTVQLTGKEILDYLEYSYGSWFNTMSDRKDHLVLFEVDERGNGRTAGKFYNYSSASGINYTVDLTKPAGEKITIQGFTDGRKFELDSIYKVAINSYRGNGGGGHLTDGSGISHDDLLKRIISSTDKDLRYIIMQHIEAMRIVSPKAKGNWKAIPQDFWIRGRKKDYQIMYDN
ncbi:MAG: bifunctional metallophosphatase/5'-nucleotidase [Bacteroidales bacterium]|nr:bifunctional metallophosphatase/5'-nucleotidase [Bacteroidales bacterium]